MSPRPPRRNSALRVLVIALALCALSCTTAKKPVAAPPPPVRSIQPAGLEQARLAYARGDYDTAYSGFEAVMEREPQGSQRMESLYHLAVIDLVRDPKARNFGRARARLGEVKVNSDYRQAEVEAILELLVTLENTRASNRKQGETIRTQETALEQKEKALRDVTETLIGGD